MLYLVATPIGNLGDMTLRAIETLRTVTCVLCEDTRVTKKLLDALHISTPTLSFHQHSDEKKMTEILERLRQGETLALVTDAGTPGISDPGGFLVERVTQAFPGVKIVPIPGASALTAALSVCGFPSDKFVFAGFPPHKKGRETYFDGVAAESKTVVLFESTHRILKTLESLKTRLGDRPIMLARELTKLHETLYRGSVSDVIDQLNQTSTKGEYVLVIRSV